MMKHVAENELWTEFKMTFIKLGVIQIPPALERNPYSNAIVLTFLKTMQQGFAITFAKTFLMMHLRFVITFLFAVIIVVACNNKPDKNTAAEKQVYTSKNTDSFNIAFDDVLNNYDSLRVAFINWDTVTADKYAALLQTSLISVPYEQLKDEAAATSATSIAQNAADGLQALIDIDSIKDKRRFFYTLSESVYHLIKTTGYDKAVIFHKKCPMAFDGEREGWWISKIKTIDNPYMGKFHPKYKNAMLECGSVEDSINNM